MAADGTDQDDSLGWTGRRSLGTIGAAIALLLMLGIGGIIFAVLVFGQPKYLDGFASVVLLIAGFVTVTLMLLVGTVVLTALGMRDPTQALGMPEGSIRALIAMVLILIFAIIGIVVFNAGTSAQTFTSSGLTQAQIDTLHAGGGIILQQNADTAAAGASPGATLYTVIMRPSMTPDSHDFGLQLLTTVSTLVVAVAGFYFGSKATQQAITAGKDFRPPPRPVPAVVGAEPDAEAVNTAGPEGDVDEDTDVDDVPEGGSIDDGEGDASGEVAVDETPDGKAAEDEAAAEQKAADDEAAAEAKAAAEDAAKDDDG